MISIIVPVYNSESTLSDTLTSLLKQTYTNLEIVCVNDGSTDSSSAILENVAKEDSRILIVNQENAGVSAARNAGICASNGDILMFVDADDRLTSNACEVVSQAFEKNNCDVVTFGMEVDPPDAAPIILRREMTPANKIYSGFEAALLFKEYSRPYACRSAVSSALIKEHNIKFVPGVKLGEDQIFYFDVYPWSKKTVLLSDSLYIYNMRNESATHTITAVDQLQAKLDQHLLVVSSIASHWKRYGFSTNFCARDLLEWFIDFLTLDINKLPIEEKSKYFQKLLNILTDYFGEVDNYAVRRPTKRLLSNIKKVADGSSDISIIAIVSFYYMRRGFRKCVERVLLKVKPVK